jgi:ATP phosphoribosyltransferase regulatory subunit
MRDYLPPEAARRRCLCSMLADLFSRWAYREIVTPCLEVSEVFAEEGRRVFQLVDQGEILVLRPEMTAAVARVVATYFREAVKPLRFFYVGNVFRQDSLQAGRLREFVQAGVELLGVRGPWADAEVISLAIEVLREAGAREFRIGLGQVQVTLGILEELDLGPEVKESIKQALVARDYVALEEIADRHGCREELDFLVSLRGGKEVLDKAYSWRPRSEVKEALEGLRQVWEALERARLADHLFLDLGLLRDFHYYTGLVFEGYAAGLGFPVLGGGRYDHLLRRFGLDMPATGFAVGVERLLAVAQSIGYDDAGAPTVLVGGSSLDAVLTRAQELRRQGKTVEMALEHHTREDALAYAAQRGIPTVEWVE